MPRLRDLVATLAILTAVLARDGGVEAADPRPPNVILFLVDDMGWMDSTPYGSRYYDTPHMARLAAQGMRFTRAYSQPLCSPTRACLLTGKNAARHGITSAVGHTPPAERSLPDSGPAHQKMLYPSSKTFLDPGEYTLAEALRDAGYRTAHIGKWHLGLTEPHWPERQGFDVAFHCHPDPGPPGGYFSPYGVTPAGSPPTPGSRRVVGTITDGPSGEYITDRLTEEAIRFVTANRDRPFFLNLWHYGVHGPWGHKEAITAALATRTDPTGRQKNPVMASMLASIDESLGRILDTLDRLGLADDTLVIFTSDNGGNTSSNTESDPKSQARERAADPSTASYQKWAGHEPPTNNAPLREGKGRLYEGGVRVPLIVRFPGRVQPGTSSDALVGCTDVYPTVLNMAGLPPQTAQTKDGSSYAAVLRGTATTARESYVIWFPGRPHGASVYQGDWKLIRRTEPSPEEGVTHELYNLRDDIGETQNLAATMPDRVGALEGIIDRLIADTAAVIPRVNPAYRAPAADVLSAGGFDGLVAKGCTATPIAGGYRIESAGRRGFLGTARVKLAGPVTLHLRARTPVGGTGLLQWRTEAEADFPPDRQGVPFTLAAGDQWQDITAVLPVQGTTAIVRLFLPTEAAAVDIETIRYVGQGQGTVWDFSRVRP